jgi:hypothetical protein
MLALPPGGYTVMRTVKREAVLEFDMHMSRLVHAVGSLVTPPLKITKGGDKDELDAPRLTVDAAGSVEGLTSFLVPALQAGVESFREAGLDDGVSDFRLTVHLSWSPTIGETLDSYIHVTQLPAVKVGLIRVAVVKVHRDNATVKDSRWSQTAKDLKEKLGEDVEDVSVSVCTFLYVYV